MLIGLIAFAPSPLEKIEDTAHAQAKTEHRTEKEITPVKEKPTIKKIQAKADKPAFNPNDASTWPKCAANEIVRADNGKCAKKPAQQPSVAQAKPAAPVSTVGSGDCASELRKYDWNHTVAYNVMMKESSGNPAALNDNPATGDYSVGCFQINLYGANARNRPSESWLKNAANNVSYAYKIYVGNGRSFLGQWGACHYVSCY